MENKNKEVNANVMLGDKVLFETKVVIDGKLKDIMKKGKLGDK